MPSFTEQPRRGDPLDPRDPRDPLDPNELAAGLELLTGFLRRLSSPGDLSLTSASTLRDLERHGPRRLSELAAEEGVTQPAMTQLVSRLEREGYVERHGDPTDARAVLVHVTARGQELLRRRRAARVERLEAILPAVPIEDQAALAAAIPAIRRLTSFLPVLRDSRERKAAGGPASGSSPATAMPGDAQCATP